MEPKTLDIATQTQPQSQVTKKGKKRSKNFFKVALYMLRGRSARKSKAVSTVDDDQSKNTWRKLVGSMRPMHLQNNHKSPPQQITKPEFDQKGNNHDGDLELGFESIPNSPSPTSSGYASAVGLSEMVPEEESIHITIREEEIKESDGEGEDGNGNGNESDGDDMIDAKADEFIAQFYQQIRLQRMNVADRSSLQRD